jgi:dTDP-4-amino-4,6-dideoxygalactose transaminase
MNIGFNKPYVSGRELHYISDAISRGKISGNGYYSKRCHDFFTETYGFKKVLLTTSCTDALEMASLLIDIQKGDEVIVPSYTFVSSANAFVLQGAQIVFADSQSFHPNMDADLLRPLITPKTKAIVVVHYAGIACDMDTIMALAKEFNLVVVEDAAQAIDSFYKGRPLGSIGHLGCISFHETKNVNCGEGGMLIVNDDRFAERAEIIWEKGTNRSAFFKGEVNKYEWIDVGSSFLLSDLNAAYLYAQLENLKKIQELRKNIWHLYYEELYELDHILVPYLLPGTTNNAHMFYIECRTSIQKEELRQFLLANGIQAITHYTPLHSSIYFNEKHDGRILENADHFSNCLLRLPLYNEITEKEVKYICKTIKRYFEKAIVIKKDTSKANNFCIYPLISLNAYFSSIELHHFY